MRLTLRILASLLGVAVMVLWLVTGAHTGWTQTKVTTMQVDPITELEFPVIEDRFVAGVDVLGGGIILALALFGLSFLFVNQPTKK